MATDLTTVPDHPATLIEGSVRGSLQSERTAGTFQAATFLRVFEREHDVTFVALDNETLEAVYEVYNRPGGIEEYEFIGLVADLLGLGD